MDEGSSVARALGLAADLPAGAEPGVIDTELLRAPCEVYAWRAGVKPVVFLTVPEPRVAETLQHFSDAHVERRDRRVLVEKGDVWIDDRSRGEARVELYVSRDAALAREAAELQAGADPSRAALRLGELMGYPACCARAFHAQRDRSDNARNRHETAARTHAHPWRYALDNLAMMLVPFFPCTYTCEPATDLARATLGAIREESAETARRVEELLRRPVLYFGHDALICFDGAAPEAGAIDYRRVLVPGSAPPDVRRLASALTCGDRLVLDAEALRVTREGATCFELRRTDNRVGFVAPFA